MSTIPTVSFQDGNQIPQLGYGVWQVADEVAEDVVQQAIRAGYRHIDTAKIYGNEAGVGRAVRAAGVPREDLFITTKLWNDDQGTEKAIAACEASLERLGLDQLDLYLIHWAIPSKGLYLESWKALIELQKRGLVRSIGVSNFPAEQLQEIVDETGVAPAIHQIELHPRFQQKQLRELNKSLGIVTEAWSPLGQGGDILKDPVITQIADKHSADPGQVIIAWHMAIGNVVIPKTVTPERIVSNFKAAQLTLSEEEVAQINELDSPDGRIGADPATADF